MTRSVATCHCDLCGGREFTLLELLWMKLKSVALNVAGLALIALGVVVG